MVSREGFCDLCQVDHLYCSWCESRRCRHVAAVLGLTAQVEPDRPFCELDYASFHVADGSLR
ncbi:MAG: hypothetical protein ACRELA_18300 [Candidatus Rokuibacteriota bacterium]